MKKVIPNNSDHNIRIPVKMWLDDIEDGALEQAKKELSLEDEIENLINIGVIHTLRGKDDLDEAPGSYKDINEVMSNQQDLVEIKTWLRPLATIKG